MPHARHSWSSSCVDCCALPGGYRTCAYVVLCPCIAAGDVAKAANRDFLLSCCLTPCGLWLAEDRAALADRFGIHDEYHGFASICLFSCGCACCLLCQELNEIQQRAPAVAPAQHVMSDHPVAQRGDGAAAQLE